MFFTRKVSQSKWDIFIKDIKKLYKKLPDDIFLVGNRINRAPQFTSECIIFNGSSVKPKDRKTDKDGDFIVDDDGHETFVFHSECDEFCKTAQKPYDFMVQVCLIMAKIHFNGKFLITSTDADFDEWTDAYEFVTRLFPKVAEKKSFIPYLKKACLIGRY